jgi:hypothetical protein
MYTLAERMLEMEYIRGDGVSLFRMGSLSSDDLSYCEGVEMCRK